MSCNEWKELTLEDIGDIVGGGTPSTKNENYYGDEISWITPKDLSGYTSKYISKGERSITKLGLEKSSAKLLPKGTVLFSSRAPIGYVAIAENELTTNQGFKSIICNPKIANNEFIYYRMKLAKYELESIAGGSTFKEVSGKVMKEFKISLPPLGEQEKIANILSSLDDKIELNNEMNKTLEEMAQSIFKRWFVDFEFPNEDGEPYKSSGGEMVDSELGMIPKGWEVQCIGDIGNVITGKTPSAKVEGSYGDECNFITPRDITDSPIILNTERKLSSIGINNLKKNLVCKNSIGVSCIGSNLGEVYITGENSITNQQINTVVLDESHIYPYVYIYLKNMKNEFLNMAGGSAVPIINKTSFSGINILMPDMYILNKFVQSTTCYFERIEENLKENESLIALRDSLLPKLMSGEIDINL